MQKEQLQKTYDDILERTKEIGASESVIVQSVKYQEKRGINDYNVFQRRIPINWDGAVVLDFGGKFGHSAPIFFALGASEVYIVEVSTNHIQSGSALFKPMYGDRIHYLVSDRGYIPVQPETTDLVIIANVISHINPMYLETVYQEAMRILKPGGMIYISDGNNLANPQRARDLLEHYRLFENGPTGDVSPLGKTVGRSQVEVRKQMILKRYPDLPEDEADFIAANTSGLFGDFFSDTVDRYMETGELIRRPYQPGVCPTKPVEGGPVIERAFFPEHVVMSLEQYRFDAYEYTQGSKHGIWPGLRGWLWNMLSRIKRGPKYLLSKRLSTSSSVVVLGRKPLN